MFLNKMLVLVVFQLSAIGWAVSEDAPSPPVAVTLDAKRIFQRIDGFGASAMGGFAMFERGYFDQVVPWGVTYRTDKIQREEMLKAAYKELGVSHVRMWIRTRLSTEQPNSRLLRGTRI